MDKNQRIAQEVLNAVGGKENVSFVTHCMTRLRFSLKNINLVKDDEVKSINGVLGVSKTGGQYQVIIGQNVPKVYDYLCEMSGLKKEAAIDENLDASKEKLTLKKLGSNIMGAIIGCLTPIIPVLIVAGLIKMIVSLIGPTMLNVVSETSDLYRLLTMVGDAGFYFFPIFAAWSASKRFGCSTVIAILLSAILIHPTFISIVNSGEPFAVFGIPMTASTYSATVLPSIMITYVLSLIEKPLKKYVPEALSTMFVPLLSVIIMLPIALCIVGPLGSIVGVYLGDLLMWIHSIFGPIGVALIGSLWILVVAAGMHVPLFTVCMVSIGTLGYDPVVLVGATMGTYATIAGLLAYTLKAKNAEDRSLGISCLAAQALGGVGEPGMFGITFRYPKVMISGMIGTFIGALYAGIMNVKLYILGSANILAVTAFGGGDDPMNIVHGGIGCIISFVIVFVLIMMFGYEGKLSFAKKGK